MSTTFILLLFIFQEMSFLVTIESFEKIGAKHLLELS